RRHDLVEAVAHLFLSRHEEFTVLEVRHRTEEVGEQLLLSRGQVAYPLFAELLIALQAILPILFRLHREALADSLPSLGGPLLHAGALLVRKAREEPERVVGQASVRCRPQTLDLRLEPRDVFRSKTAPHSRGR